MLIKGELNAVGILYFHLAGQNLTPKYNRITSFLPMCLWVDWNVCTPGYNVQGAPGVRPQSPEASLHDGHHRCLGGWVNARDPS